MAGRKRGPIMVRKCDADGAIAMLQEEVEVLRGDIQARDEQLNRVDGNYNALGNRLMPAPGTAAAFAVSDGVMIIHQAPTNRRGEIGLATIKLDFEAAVALSEQIDIAATLERVRRDKAEVAGLDNIDLASLTTLVRNILPAPAQQQG
jgi:hypothetical protein